MQRQHFLVLVSFCSALVAGQQCLDNCVKAATKNQPKICSEQSAKKAAKACIVGYRSAIQDSCSQTCDAGGLVNLVPSPDSACAAYRNILPKPSVHKGCSQGYRNGFEEVMRVVHHMGIEGFGQKGDSVDEPRVNMAAQRERQEPGQYTRTERRRRTVEVNQGPKDHQATPQRAQDRLEARHARTEQVQQPRIPQRRAIEKTEDNIKTEVKEAAKKVEVKENVIEKTQETKEDEVSQRSTKLAKEGKVELNKMILDETKQENPEDKAKKIEVNKMILDKKEEAKVEEVAQPPVEEKKVEVSEVVVEKKVENQQVEENKAPEKLEEEQKVERNKVIMDEKSEKANKKNEEANLLETLQRSIKMADQRDVGKKHVPEVVAEKIKEIKPEEHKPMAIVGEAEHANKAHKEAKKTSTLKGSKVQEVAEQVLKSIDEILHHKEKAHAVLQDGSAPLAADTPETPSGAV